MLRWGQYRRILPLGTAISGALMIAMGVLAIVLAVTGPGMPSGGWQTEMSGWLEHVSASMLHALSWLPGLRIESLSMRTHEYLANRVRTSCSSRCVPTPRY